MKKLLIIGATLAILGCKEKIAEPTPPPAATQATEQEPLVRGESGAPDAAASVRITSPADKQGVTILEIVRGTTSVPGKNHYIIVTPLSAPQRWVQDGPATVNTDGTWFGDARFGTDTQGINEDFKIECVATAQTLEPGRIEVANLPGDGVYSAPVVVHRAN